MACGFNGTTSVIDHGNSSSLEFGGDTTIAVWFRSAAGDSTGRRLVSKRTDGTNNIDVTIADYAGANTIEIGRTRATVDQVAGAGGAFTPNTWHLGIFVFTASDQPRIYIGSEASPPAEVGSYGYADAGSGTVSSGAGSFFFVGKRATINSLNGAIAIVGMFSRAFDATDRLNLWSSGAATWATDPDCQLVSHYSGTGSQTDLGPFGNHGSATDVTDQSDPTWPSGVASVDQTATRFRSDDGSETTATWKASENSNVTAPLGANLRLRVQIDGTNDPASAAYTLRYKKSTDGTYIDVPVGATPSAPTWVANGAQSIAAGAITPALPAGIAVGDILVLFIETANQAASIANANGGTWTEVGSQAGTGTGGSTSATRLSVFWSRYNGTQTAPQTNDSGDHQLGFIAAFRGCIDTGSPIDVAGSHGTDTGPTTLTLSGVTTTVDNALVVLAVADDWDNASTTRYTSWTNANLSSLTERFDGGSTTQNGGGIGMAVGTKATAGATGNTTVDQNASIAVNSYVTFALKPQPRPIYISPSANITAGGEATTAQLTAPTGKTTGDFTTGRMWDNENGSDTIDIGTDEYTEVEWCLQAQSPAANADVYQFRVYAGTSALSSYTVTPEWTIGSVGGFQAAWALGSNVMMGGGSAP